LTNAYGPEHEAKRALTDYHTQVTRGDDDPKS
jgi:hypothetical protein